MTPLLWLLSCLGRALLGQAQFPALLMISLHTAEAFRQVAPVDVTVPKMDILAYVRMWAAMLLMTFLENENTDILLPVSSSMQISVLRLILCAGIVVREPTASR